jgi:ribonucleoside-diphosphate reductase alpha chain
VLDYIARWLGGRFISSDYFKLNGDQGTAAHSVPAAAILPATAASAEALPLPPPVSVAASSKPRESYEGAPTCSECGMLMVPNGACYKCENCGSTSGCS